MAGSLKWMKYESDDGGEYRVKVDESNGEAFGFDDILVTSTDALVELPKRYEMRYVVWRSNSGDISRKFHCGKPTNADFVVGGDYTVPILSGNTVQSVAGSFTYAVGEKRPMYLAASGAGLSTNTATDTGLNDSDNS